MESSAAGEPGRRDSQTADGPGSKRLKAVQCVLVVDVERGDSKVRALIVRPPTLGALLEAKPLLCHSVIPSPELLVVEELPTRTKISPQSSNDQGGNLSKDRALMV